MFFSAFSLLKEAGRDGHCDNVVKGVSSCRNSEAANGEQNRKIDPRDRPKNELCHVERVGLIWPAAEEINVVMRAEQRRRDKNRKYDRVLVRKPEDILKQQH